MTWMMQLILAYGTEWMIGRFGIWEAYDEASVLDEAAASSLASDFEGAA